MQLKLNKRIITGIAVIVVLAVVGTVGALNGWFGGGATIPEDTFTRGLVGYWNMDESNGSLAKDSSPYANDGMINDGGAGNPISYWTFDEQTGTTAYDSIGTNNGTLTNSPTWTSSGKVGGTLSFDGVDDYVNVPYDSSLDSFDELTVSLWIKPTVFGDGYDRFIIEKGWYTTGSFLLYVNNSGNSIHFATKDSIAQRNASFDNGLVLNQWTYVVATFKKNDYVKIYVNGIKGNDSIATADETLTKNSALKIAQSTNAFRGAVDDIKIYNYVRTTEQIQRDYLETYKSKWTQGKIAGAMQFDGVDDFVGVKDNDNLDFDATDNFTVETWFKTSASGSRFTIVRKGEAGFNPYYAIHIFGDDGTNRLSFSVFDGATGPEATAGTGFNDGNWHHVVGIVNRTTNYSYIYVDGIFKQSQSLSGVGSFINDRPLYIGARPQSVPDTFFNGFVDEVKIYNRALSAAEVKFHYNRGGPVAYWKFDEGSGTLVSDISGNMNNAVIHGPSLSFDGVDDYTYIAHSTSTDIVSALTMEVWVKPNGTNEDGYVIAKIGNGANNQGYSMYWAGSGDKIQFYGPVSSNPLSDAVFTDSNTWVHVTITFDGKTIRFYRNGVAAGSANDTLPSNIYPLLIGNRWDSGTSAPANYATTWFNGLIDEPRIYNRALTANEVIEHYRGIFKNETGLVLHLPFDENTGDTAYDKSSYANNGNLAGSGTTCGTGGACPTWTARTGPTWTTGKYGNALGFDGVDDYLDVGDSTNLNIIGAITIEAWIKPTNLINQNVVVSRGSGGATNLQYLLTVEDNIPKFYIATGTNIPYAAGTAISLNTWTHLVGTFSGSYLQIYVNGVSGVGSSWSGTQPMPSNTTCIGVYSALKNYPFTGSIDDVRIYPYARTADEILLDYNSGFSSKFGPNSSVCSINPGSCITNGLVGYWSFDEADGQKAKDLSGEENNGWLGSSASADIYDPKWTQGKVNGALIFDGSNDFVNLTDNSSLDFGLNSFTVNLWVKSNSIVYYGGIFSKIGSTRGYACYSHTSTNALRCALDDGSVYGYTFGSNIAPFDNKWHYVSFMVDRSVNRAYAYMDGIRSTDYWDISSIGNLDNTANFIIGESHIGGYFDGSIDEVRIYNRALSAEEIRYQYNAGGPVAYWKFDEGSGTLVSDISGNMNNSVIHGPSLSFDGGDYVSVANSTSLNPSLITMTAWIKPSSVSGTYRIIQKGGGTSIYDLWIQSDATLRFRVTNYLNNPLDVTTTATLSVNTWYFVSAVYDSTSGRYEIWINGTLSKTGTTVGNILTTNTTGLVVGAGNITTPANFFNGLIDEPRIYNRALSVTEILEQYRGIFKADTGLVMHLPFDENTGDTAYDKSSYANNGDLAGSGTTCGTGGACPTWTARTGPTWTTGKYGNALSFDGVDDYLDVGKETKLDITGEITVSSWVNVSNFSLTGYMVGKRGSSASACGGYGLHPVGNQFSFYIADGAGGYKEFKTSNYYETGKWYYIVGVYNDSADSIKIYVNGELENSGSTTVSLTTCPNNNLQIGRFPDNASIYFGGIVDDISIYPYARTADEIRLDYNQGAAAKFSPNSSSCSANPGSCVTNGLVGYWSFDEAEGQKAKDLSGEGNDGWLGSSTSADTTDPKWTQGKVNGALSFDGVNDYVEIGYGTSLNMHGTSSITVSVWIKTNSAGGSYQCVVVRNGDSTNAQGTIQLTSTNQFRFLITTTNGLISVVSTDIIPTYQWTLLTGTYDGSNVKLYINGNLIKTTAETGNINVASNAGTRIGNMNYFNGLIDEVRIYNRALLAEEIRYQYNKGQPVAQWKFNEGEGVTAYDSTGGNNDGVLTNGPIWVEGKSGSAINFDGTDDYVSVADSSILDITNAITVEAWVKYDLAVHTAGIIEKSGAYGMWTRHHPSSGRVGFYSGVYVDGAYRDVFVGYGDDVYTDGEWIHCAFTYDSTTHHMTDYLNGKVLADGEILTGLSSYTIAASANNLTIGRGVNYGTKYINGSIDDVRIYNYARTPEQIYQDYNSGSASFK